MYTGKDSLVFWFGVIEDRLDPLEIGRCRVRILGFHPQLKKDFPTNKLPWAQIIQPSHSASLSGKGISPTGLVEGSWVVGFFVDNGSAQIPIIMGSICGMNEETKEGDNPGDCFRDLREENDLAIFPVDEFEKKEYPNGKESDGDAHGAQIKNVSKSKNYPRELYSPESSGRERGTPDLNILAIGDLQRIDKTIVKTKRDPVGSGLRDIGIDVADCDTPRFNCGVTNESGVNIGTIKGLGIGVNSQESSSVPSRKTKYKQFKDKPTNNNAIQIDSSKTMNLKPTMVDTAATVDTSIGLA
jgi:hypothetical protein